MAFERLSFRGPLSLAVRLSQCAGCVVQFKGTLYECVVAGWTPEPHGPSVVGHVLFTPVAEQGSHPTFPEDLLKELLASTP